MPTVSVVLVFHKDTPFLRPAITSVLRQTLRDLELVLVDNGLGFGPTLLGECGRDPRVRWVHLESDEGIGAAMNAGITASNAEFVALADFDDLSYPRRLERQVAALCADPGLGMVSARARRIDVQDRPIVGEVFTLLRPNEFKVYSQYAAPVINPLLTGRREIFEALPFRPQFRYASELDFQARVTERQRLTVLPEVLMDYRVYSEQATIVHASSIEQSRCAITLLTARRRAGQPENPQSVFPIEAERKASDYCLRSAAQCLAEGFSVPAAYLARRSFALERIPQRAFAAGRLGLRAWRQAKPAERGLAARMFFTGPVKALNLRPV